MATHTRQIILDAVCDVYTTQQIDVHYNVHDKANEFTQKRNRMNRIKFVRNGDKGVVFAEQSDPNGYYGFFDKPALGIGLIQESNIELIVYHNDQDIKNTPSLKHYRKGDKIETEIDDIRNWQVGKVTPKHWVKAEVTDTGMVYPPKSKPYPFVQVVFTRTYWKGDSNGNGEFFEKESIEREYNAESVRFAKESIVKV
jgi:hypothetical protein